MPRRRRSRSQSSASSARDQHPAGLTASVCVVGIVSYILKQRLFIASSVIALLLGVAVGPTGWGWIDPLRWTDGDLDRRNELSYEIFRVVIGIQVLVTGVRPRPRRRSDAAD